MTTTPIMVSFRNWLHIQSVTPKVYATGKFDGHFTSEIQIYIDRKHLRISSVKFTPRIFFSEKICQGQLRLMYIKFSTNKVTH